MTMARILSPVVHHKPLTCVSDAYGHKALCGLQVETKSRKGVRAMNRRIMQKPLHSMRQDVLQLVNG